MRRTKSERRAYEAAQAEGSLGKRVVYGSRPATEAQMAMTMVTVSGDWTPPYTVEVWTETEAIGEVIALPGLEPEVILVRPDRPLRREEQVAVNEYFRRVYPHVPTPFPDAEGPGAV